MEVIVGWDEVLFVVDIKVYVGVVGEIWLVYIYVYFYYVGC